eukprot:TRINITY_DN748_c0_g1_i1.p1 TRINITY_DN748_c0_g1~~TRINITY_DN748_c0_g1_i1.p1  ORF type:complete len:432 (-),score=86.17 TRINITY_DN748_c0_g1_i1:201-1496(-)
MVSLRSLSLIAAVAQPAVGINNKLFNEVNAGMTLAVQEQQYAILFDERELGASLISSSAQKENSLEGLSAKEAGERATLNEEGYSAVADLRSKEAMDAFAARLIQQDGLEVGDVDTLNRVLPFYNGDCAKQSFDALRLELNEATSPHGCKKAWMKRKSSSSKSVKNSVSLLEEPSAFVKPQNGDVAPLNQDGYLAVSLLKNNEEMKTYIRRLSKKLGLTVMNEGGLSGFAPYYSGVCARRSYKALVKELRSVQPVVKATSISYELQPGEDVDQLKQRIAAATGLPVDQIDVGFDDGKPLDAVQMRTALATKIGVEEGRVNVMKVNSTVQDSPIPAPVSLVSQSAQPAPHPTEQGSQSAPQLESPAPQVEPQQEKRTVVVTVTATNGISVEDALTKLASNSSAGLTLKSNPVTMTASIPKPESCGGGWVAPH